MFKPSITTKEKVVTNSPYFKQFCQYVTGPCNQVREVNLNKAFFAYAGQPEAIAEAIENTIKKLRQERGDIDWFGWKNLPVHGKIIFCEICKGVHKSKYIFADVTTLNFNLLFEIGYALGMNKTIVPIRDTSYVMDNKQFTELGVLDAMGYIDFKNSTELSERISEFVDRPRQTEDNPTPSINIQSPLYVLRGPVESEGALEFLNVIRRSEIKYRQYDAIETPRLSLYEVRKQVSQSVGILAHLLSPNRKGSTIHNGLCAFVAGMAMAQGKVVGLIQEENVQQPLDYREMVQWYSRPSQISGLLEMPIKNIVKGIQAKPITIDPLISKGLEKIDLGESAAENEIAGLQDYYVPIGQYHKALHANYCVVTGRKGTGKTAMFYKLQSSSTGNRHLTIALKPEGNQFERMKEGLLKRMDKGVRGHTLLGFWTYILVTEIAVEILKNDKAYAHADNLRLQAYDSVGAIVKDININVNDDFSARLMTEVDKLVGGVALDESPENLTKRIFGDSFGPLFDAVRRYIEHKDKVTILIDNIDKGWPTNTVTEYDIAIVRNLIDAAKKLNQQMEKKKITVSSVVFLRSDIMWHLERSTSDKGKDTDISLETADIEVFKDIINRRLMSSGLRGRQFQENWTSLFPSHVGSVDSFRYIAERTMMRSRDLLNFIKTCIGIAIDRGHKTVTEADVVEAEKAFSNDMLYLLESEINDTQIDKGKLMYSFLQSKSELGFDEVRALLTSQGVVDLDHSIELLLWFGFLGIKDKTSHIEEYSFNVKYNITKLITKARMGNAFVIHKGFHTALSIQ